MAQRVGTGSQARTELRTGSGAAGFGRELLNKVPEVTVYFWLIKILCTTVGETAADLLSDTAGLGLGLTTIIVGVLLIGALYVQFRSTRYVPLTYWVTVVLISIVGTLITDYLVEKQNVALLTTTILFAIGLAATFAVWYASERTLSIHSIVTVRREAFYWLAILFTFALGTSAGDYIAEQLNLGYWKSALMFGGVIALIAIAFFQFNLNAVGAFWGAYILTRPLGASIGDYLSQPRDEGGLGLGTTVTSIVFLAAILALVLYLTVTRMDAPEPEPAAA